MVDLLLFNPPYVVTPSEEVQSHGIEASWAGGKKGREVMDRVFPLVADLLSTGGLFYLVTIKENNPGDQLPWTPLFQTRFNTINQTRN
ncbi:UNVERIFIED_CONTAM: hypothetical protein H355_013760 [Colinus virginianus]|nr:hypothetical protein H355_013760 [Colinus virginianus]